jgi:hypothetical protein
VELWLHTLTLAIDGEWSALCPSHFTPEAKSPQYLVNRSWMGPRAGLDMGMKRGKEIPSLPLLGIEPWLSSPLEIWRITRYLNLKYWYPSTKTL